MKYFSHTAKIWRQRKQLPNMVHIVLQEITNSWQPFYNCVSSKLWQSGEGTCVQSFTLHRFLKVCIHSGLYFKSNEIEVCILHFVFKNVSLCVGNGVRVVFLFTTAYTVEVGLRSLHQLRWNYHMHNSVQQHFFSLPTTWQHNSDVILLSHGCMTMEKDHFPFFFFF